MPGFLTLPKPSNWPPVYAECDGEDTLLPGGGTGGHEVITFYRDATAQILKLQVDSVESYAVLAETEADAQRTMDVLADPAFRRCVQDGLAVAQEETVVNDQVVGSSTIDLETPAVGDEVVAFRVTVDEAEHHFDHELHRYPKGPGPGVPLHRPPRNGLLPRHRTTAPGYGDCVPDAVAIAAVRSPAAVDYLGVGRPRWLRVVPGPGELPDIGAVPRS